MLKKPAEDTGGNGANQKSYLTRKEAAAFLSEQGLPITPDTLQKLACVGGGPEYALFGNKSIYTPSKLLMWATGRLTATRRASTSDGGTGTK